MRKNIVMSADKISEYIRKVHERRTDDLTSHIKSHGQINDIDYYVEVMKKYYPDSKPNLIIYLGGKHNG